MFYVLTSIIEGSGVYAARDIKAGEEVYFYPAEEMMICDLKNIEKLPPAEKEEFIRYSYQVDDDLWVWPRDDSDFFNHSCSPNCYLPDESTIRTLVDVERGEELTIDYAFTDSFELSPPFSCLCKSPECRKLITAHDWKIPELQKKYEGKFLPYINKKINTK